MCALLAPCDPGAALRNRAFTPRHTFAAALPSPDSGPRRIYLTFMPQLLGLLLIQNLWGEFMKNKRQMIPAVGLLATAIAAVYMVAQLNGQATAPSADFTNAAFAEVRDAQGQVVLSGPFQAVDEDDDDVERKAVLAPAGVDADAAGEAEVEFSRNAPANQEVEFSVRNMTPNAAFTFVIDGTTVATATADGRGRAEVELDVRMPGAAASR
jgi:hypothetical protein